MIENEDDARLQHYIDLIYEEVTLEEFKEMKTLPAVDVESEQVTFFDPAG